MKSLKCPNCGGPIELEESEVRTARPGCGGSLERTITVPRATAGAGAGRRPELPGVPFLDAYLIRLEDEGWCWYLSTLSGQPNIPRFRARDGRMWPYWAPTSAQTHCRHQNLEPSS